MIVKGADVAVIMGSTSDDEIMCHSVNLFKELELHYTYNIVSAHRTPERLYEFGHNVESAGIRIIIAGAGGAAHLPGMVASLTCIPVLGVPINTTPLNGLDSLYSISQMPRGVPVATFAIGKPGAINAALFAASIIGLNNDKVMRNLKEWRKKQTDSIPYEI